VYSTIRVGNTFSIFLKTVIFEYLLIRAINFFLPNDTKHSNKRLHIGQNRQKTVCVSAFFVNSALKILCHIVINTFLQTVFFLPTGFELACEILILKMNSHLKD